MTIELSTISKAERQEYTWVGLYFWENEGEKQMLLVIDNCVGDIMK